MTVTARWLGHSTVRIESSKASFIIDPFVTGNPNAAARLDELKADYVLLTHDHDDHAKDVEYFLKKGATFVGIHEHAVAWSEKGYKTEGMNIGGTITLGDAKIFMTHATHTSSVGLVAGFVIEVEERQIYHAGDTGLTYDMKILGEFYKIDLAFLPIGDRYTMGASHAAIAADWIGAKKVVPIHYLTWPPIAANVTQFRRLLGERSSVLTTGDTIKV